MIAEEYPDGFHPADVVHDDPALLITVAAAIHRRYLDRTAGISGQLPGYERIISDDWVVSLGDTRHHVTVRPIMAGMPPVDGDKDLAAPMCGHEVHYNGQTYRVFSDWQFGQPLFKGTIDGVPICVQVERRNLKYRLFHWGAQVDVVVLSARAAELLAAMPEKKPPDTSKFLLSPMPGLLSQLLVAVGDEIKTGQQLAVVEAMKMENVLCAARRPGAKIVGQRRRDCGGRSTVDGV